MYIQPVYSLSFIFITLFIAFLFVKRINKKGCGTFLYVSAVLFCINLFLIFSWVFFSKTIKEVYNVSTSGESYTGTVVSFTQKEHYDSEEGTYETMYTPTIEFTTKTGKLIKRELDFSTSGIAIGDVYTVNYNEGNDKVITLGFTLIMKLVGSFIFCFIFTFLFTGVINYVLGNKMDMYYNIASIAGFYFFIPFLMIGFNALLIYAVFYGNEVPTFVTFLLCFFVFILTLAIWGYIKMMLSKGVPKMKKVSHGKWTADWED